MTEPRSLRSLFAGLFIIGIGIGAACSTSEGGGPGGGGASAAGNAGTTGTGSAGSSGNAGTTGSAGDSGSGAAGTGGTAGSTTGAAGITGAAGTSGAAGTTGGGGTSGGAGAAAGRGGTTGAAGAAAGRGGGAGTSVAGATGTAGSGGSTGSAGTGGSPGSACSGTASSTPANTMTVNVDAAANAIKSELFGLLMERLGKNWNGGIFVGTSSSIPNTNGMRNDVIDAFKEAGVGMIEWPGGCAAGSYNWSANKNPSNDVGTDRYMQLCQILGIPPMIAGPGTSAGAAQNLAWIQYINNNTAHPEWPPVNHFKIGNEVWGCGGNQTEATYEPNYLANYNMLSAPINGKKVNLVAGTDLIGRWPWLDTMLGNIGDKIDGIEIHDYIYHPDDYPNVGFTDAQYYSIVHAANKGQMGPRIDTAIMYLDKHDPAKRIKIYEDEWGDWLMNFAASDDWLQQGTLMDAISGAETLHLFMAKTERFAMAALAQGINVIHSLLLTRSSDAALVKTPTFYVFKMFLPHHRNGAKWAPNTLTSENITGNGQTFPVLSAGSSVDDQGRVNISLVNVDLVNTRSIRVTLTSAKAGYTVSAAQILTGPAKDSYNDYAQTEKVNIQTLGASSCSISGKTLQVTLPAKSVVMLTLTPTG